ncbi:MAG: hypothetical protein E3J72_06275 [Planctomycetota bacterium]|nr:MAG: hypothetical protein E3J72_06275 [Planctomycetota bacterium]
MYRKLAIFIVLTLFATWSIAPPVFAKDHTVTVIGEGAGEGESGKEDAKNNARRKACEQAIGVLIASKTKVKNFAVALDMIVTKVKGIVKSEKVLEGPTYDESTGITTVKMEITVGEADLNTKWEEVEMTLKRMGRPKIIIMITDRKDGKVCDQQWTEATISNHFIKSGFTLIDKDTFDEKMKREANAASLQGDINMLADIGKKVGARLVIRGTCTASQQGKMKHPQLGQWLYTYKGELTIKAIETSSATVIFNKPFVSKRPHPGGTNPDSAGKKAAEKVAKESAKALVDGIVNAWTDELNNGREITLIISNIGFRSKKKLEKLLKKIPRVREVHPGTYTSKVATFTIRTYRSADSLAERLLELKAGKLDFTGEDVEVVSVETSQVTIKLPG